MRTVSLATTLWGSASALVLLVNISSFAPATDIQQPGTQPNQAMLLGAVSACDGCHGYYNQAVEPAENWMGSMMAHSARDPLFFAGLAIAEGSVPGAGDFCIRCHAPRGWLDGNASPSDGSALDPVNDKNGIECGICHSLVNPNTQEHPGVQIAPYVANDGGTPPEGFYGSGMYVVSGTQTRYGPYDQGVTAGHAWAKSLYHRSPELCGTCHDVSNPLVGDLAPGNGAQVPLPVGSFSGVPNSPVTTKAAFLNAPHTYGIVERTYSEHKSSALATTPVSSYASLPADLQRGAIQRAHQQSLLAGQNGDYEDGTTRYFSCQTCHMEPVVGEGVAFNIGPVRYDLPLHDLTGANTWVPDLMRWLDGQNRLVFGGGLNQTQSQALDRGILRARASLQRAGALDVTGNNLRVTNLTGHKLITGYPEGRRMWLRTVWKDEAGNVLRDDGEYGAFTATVGGNTYTAHSILDPNARVYQAKFGITQDWAFQLLTLGVDPNLPLAFDRVTGAVAMTLIQLASQPPGTQMETFHFVLNNKLIADNRIPPYGFSYDEARTRNALPVPATQYGNPGPAGTYDHFDDVTLAPPAGATRAEIELLYQTASWEYIQFLKLANPGTSQFLAGAGDAVFDGYFATGESTPERMAFARWCNLPGTGEDLVVKTGVNGATPDDTCGKQLGGGDTVVFEVTSPNGTFASNFGALCFQLHDASAPPSPTFPSLRLDRIDAQINLFGLPVGGRTASITIPNWLTGTMIRGQAIMLATGAVNGTYAASNAHDVWVP